MGYIDGRINVPWYNMNKWKHPMGYIHGRINVPWYKFNIMEASHGTHLYPMGNIHGQINVL
jgi:hypothetical protein